MSYQTPFNHLRVGQVAEIYGVSPPTIWRWLRKEVIDYMLSLHKEK